MIILVCCLFYVVFFNVVVMGFKLVWVYISWVYNNLINKMFYKLNEDLNFGSLEIGI